MQYIKKIKSKFVKKNVPPSNGTGDLWIFLSLGISEIIKIFCKKFKFLNNKKFKIIFKNIIIINIFHSFYYDPSTLKKFLSTNKN